MRQFHFFTSFFSLLLLLNLQITTLNAQSAQEKWQGTWRVIGEFQQGEMTLGVNGGGEFFGGSLELYNNQNQKLQYTFSVSAGQISSVKPSEIMLTGEGYQNPKAEKGESKAGIRMFFVKYRKKSDEAVGYFSIGGGGLPNENALKQPFHLVKIR